MSETILPRININNSISNNHIHKLSSSIDSSISLTSNTLLLQNKLLKQREFTSSPIKINNNNNNSRSKSANNKNDESNTSITRLGLCTSPVTKREVVEARLESLKQGKDSFAVLQHTFVAKFNSISKDDNITNNNIGISFIQNNDNNGSLITDNKKNVNPLSLSLRQTSAEIQSYQESTKRRLKKVDLDISTVKPPRSGESLDDKQRKRNRLRAETYAINAYLKKIENSKWEKLKAEQTQADDISWCSDDSSVLPTPRYRTSIEKKKSTKDSKTDTIKNPSNSNSGKKITPRFGGV